MKIFASLSSYAIAASTDFWVNSYDNSARIPCADLTSLENVVQISWFRSELTGSKTEIAELVNENGVIKNAEKVPGYRVDDTGALVISKFDDDDFSLNDIAFYKCQADVKDEKGTITPVDINRKLVVNFIMDKNDLEPVVRDKRLGEGEKKEYKEGIRYEIAECESKEAGPEAPQLIWRAFDSSGNEISTSNKFGSCKNKLKSLDDSNFCGKTNDFIHMDKQDQRKLQTTTLPLAFDATSIEGISSEFDKAHFQCEAHYKEAWNGELVEVIKTKRWPADDNIIRVIAPVRNVDILVNGAPVSAGVLDMTNGNPSLECSSDGFDNKGANEINPQGTRSRVGDNMKFSCKARNSLNEGKWVEKEFIFTEATLNTPTAEYSHYGLVAKVTAESTPKDPEIANLKYAVFQCKEGFAAKNNREIYNILSENCIEAKALTDGTKHFIDREIMREYPIGFGVAMLEVMDVNGNTETLYNYVPMKSPRTNYANKEDEPFPMQAWFDRMTVSVSRRLRSISRDNIVAFYYIEDEQSIVDLSGDAVIDEENEDQFHVVMEPSPTESGNYVLCYDFSDKIDLQELQGQTYDSIRESLQRDHADFCRFFVNKSFPWWIILVVIIVLILIGALIFFLIKRKKDGEEENDSGDIVRDPKTGGSVSGVQTQETDARDEFAKVVENQPDETTPLRKEGEESTAV